ncbi:MAG TPA: sulfite exporter TauE/SafE family protein [Gaiellaceae bacterium]|nr:sulfite exporter TauE/SafE family protein [Gaiellaceae bacterium]
MSTTTIALALVLGFGAGALSGLFGVGGGILFVPTLALVVGLSQLDAQATSLAAMIPVVAFGAWQQQRAGNVRWKAGLAVGTASILGVVGGAALAASLDEDLLRNLFAVFLLFVAAQLLWSTRGP